MGVSNFAVNWRGTFASVLMFAGACADDVEPASTTSATGGSTGTDGFETDASMTSSGTAATDPSSSGPATDASGTTSTATTGIHSTTGTTPGSDGSSTTNSESSGDDTGASTSGATSTQGDASADDSTDDQGTMDATTQSDDDSSETGDEATTDDDDDTGTTDTTTGDEGTDDGSADDEGMDTTTSSGDDDGSDTTSSTGDDDGTDTTSSTGDDDGTDTDDDGDTGDDGDPECPGLDRTPACGDGIAAAGEFCLPTTPDYTSVRTDVGSHGLASGDLTGDGHRDLLVSRATPTEAALGIVAGDGSGDFLPLGFGPFIPGTTHSSSPAPLVLGHFDADAQLDFATFTRANSQDPPLLHVRLGTAHGAFLPTDFDPLELTWNHIRLRVGSYDGDAIDDILLIDNSYVEIYTLSGAGQLSLAHEFQDHSIHLHTDVHYVDVNGDGLDDIVHITPSRINVRLRQWPDAGFSEPIESVTGLSGASSAMLADVAGSSAVDLVLLQRGTPSLVAYLEGDGTGSFTYDGTLTWPFEKDAHRGALRDLNDDGHLDLLVHHDLSDKLLVRLGNSSGTADMFGAQTDLLSSHAPGMESWSLTFGEFTGGEAVDIAYARNDDGHEISVLRGKGDGIFEPHATVVSPTAYADALATAPLGSQGNDGLVVLADDYPGHANGPAQNTLSVLVQDGDGNFGHVALESADDRGEFSDFLVHDIDADGHLDVLASRKKWTPRPHSLVVWRGNGAGGYSRPDRYPLPDSAKHLAVGDFNGNDADDVVFLNDDDPTNDRVSIYNNVGSGRFAEQPFDVELGDTVSDPSHLAVGDFDGDGNHDFAVLGGRESAGHLAVAVWYADGAFVFDQAHVTHPTAAKKATSFEGLVAARLDADGRDDLAFYDRAARTVRIHLAGPNRSFGDQLVVSAHPAADGMVIADMDADGHLDIITLSSSNGHLRVLFGDGTGHYDGNDPNRHADLEVEGSNSPRSAIVADFDHDCAPDLVLRGSAAYTVYLARP